ncbi:uncharacterized protein ANIA_00547 [Aspergillus nidulans FGSC A4]|uniref:Major facilitator superfamily (MFS) profile domain-containing protein n=1 Tax=Emericella nidulans (strain FGSC A4 / ATCC 38163 / CBS 112.46 / NRRL 194 / M139) TaxID=227321 RepID=C8VSM1_EMENI|nr:hypothetical protein [Aspergillus nidulans FGSC A4]CBF89260.1 TPA: conserved hypothetical protein [Aspergillus nidulans FGSC A4]
MASEHGSPGRAVTDRQNAQLHKTPSGHEQEGSSAEKASETLTEEVGWDGPMDPARPANWRRKKKWWNMGIISYLTFLTPLTSSIDAPAQGLVMGDFQSANRTLASFVVSIHLIGPLFLAPFSEMFGRLRIYQVGTLTFTICNIAGALAPNIGALLVFRLFAGISGSSPVTLGAGSVADMFARQERGVAMSIYGLGPLLDPVSGIAVILVFSVLSESYEPVLLRRKANRIRHETRSQVNAAQALKPDSRKVSTQAITRPTKLLLFTSNVALFSLYRHDCNNCLSIIGVVSGYPYLLFTTVTELYEATYYFWQSATGFVSIGIGVGALIGISCFGALSDKIQNRLIARNNGQAEPEFRLPPLIPGSLLIPIGLF